MVGGGDQERILTVTHLLFQLSFIFGTSTCHSMKSYNVKKITFLKYFPNKLTLCAWLPISLEES